MELSLRGRHALITGGTRGIGRASVLALARAGAEVLTCYRTEGEDASSLERELKEIGGQHHLVQADVSDAEQVARLADVCRERLGSVDIVVNNAGIMSQGPIAALPHQEWDRMIGHNLTAAFLVTQAMLPLVPDGGSIINVGARGATNGIPFRAHYAAAKAGLIGLTRSLSKELGRNRVRVNLVAPGMVESEQDVEPNEHKARFLNAIALGRFGTPEDIAGVVLFLASDLSSYVTGETIHVDGGV